MSSLMFCRGALPDVFIYPYAFAHFARVRHR